MPCMVVTLDVSRLSGWLNADASYRAERKAYNGGRGMKCKMRARRREGVRWRLNKQRLKQGPT